MSKLHNYVHLIGKIVKPKSKIRKLLPSKDLESSLSIERGSNFSFTFSFTCCRFITSVFQKYQNYSNYRWSKQHLGYPISRFIVTVL